MFASSVDAVGPNVAPVFTMANTVVNVDEDNAAGMTSPIANFATNINVGDPAILLRNNPGGKQNWEFEVIIISQTPRPPIKLFTSDPAMNPSSGSCSTTCPPPPDMCLTSPVTCTATQAALEFTLAPDASGIVEIEVVLKDSGGVIPGVDEVRKRFTLNILEVNDGLPTFELNPGNNRVIEVFEDSCNTITGWVHKFNQGNPFEHFSGESLDYQLFPGPGYSFGRDIFRGKPDPMLCAQPCTAPAQPGAGHTGIDVSFPEGTLTFCTASNIVDTALVTMSCVDECTNGQPLRPAHFGTRDWPCWDAALWQKCPDISFEISIIPVNDPPGICPEVTEITVNECAVVGNSMAGGCSHSVDLYPSMAMAGRRPKIMTPGGGPDESAQVVDQDIKVKETALYTHLPVMDSDTGILTFGLRTFGSTFDNKDKLTLVFHDTGGVENRWCSGKVGPACNPGDDKRVCEITLKIVEVNEPPLWTVGPKQTIEEDTQLTRTPGFATSISAGIDPNEKDQPLSFTCVENPDANGATFLRVPPTIDYPSGDLEYHPKEDAFGTASVTCSLSDGIDTTPHSFEIEITPVNDCPKLTSDVDKLSCVQGETCTAPVGTQYAGADNEAGQTFSYDMWIDPKFGLNTLFSSIPAMNPLDGTFTFACGSDALGQTTIRLSLKDSGESVRPHCNIDMPKDLTLLCTKQNVPPSFKITLPDNNRRTWMQDSTPQSFDLHATEISKGGIADAWQTLSFTVVLSSLTDSNVLQQLGITGPQKLQDIDLAKIFAEPPKIDAATGTLTYRLRDANPFFAKLGLTVVLTDDGNAPWNVSPPQTFELWIRQETAPSFSAVPVVSVLEDSGPLRLIWATDIDEGGSQPFVFEKNATCAGEAALFGASGVGITPDPDTGVAFIEFTPQPDANGELECDVCIKSQGAASTPTLDCETLRILVQSVNDPPHFDLLRTHVNVSEDNGVALPDGTKPPVGAFRIEGIIGGAHVGAPDEALAGQRLEWSVHVAHELRPLLRTPPQVLPNKNHASNKLWDLVFETYADSWGTADLLVTAEDRHARIVSANTTHTVHLTVAAENDPPSFTPGGPVPVLSELGSSGLQSAGGSGGVRTVLAWASNVTAGARDEESTQTVHFSLDPVDGSTAGDDLFVTPPQLKPDGTLVVEAKKGVTGLADYKVVLTDDGTPVRSSPVSKGPLLRITVRRTADEAPVDWSALPKTQLELVEDQGPVVVAEFGQAAARSADSVLRVNVVAGAAHFEEGPVLAFDDDVTRFATLRFTMKKDYYGEVRIECFVDASANSSGSGAGGRTVGAVTAIVVAPVNDPPSFYVAEMNKVLHFDATDKRASFARWAPAERITAGPFEDDDQKVAFAVSVAEYSGGVPLPENAFAVSKFGELMLGLPLRPLPAEPQAALHLGLTVNATDSEGLASLESEGVSVVILAEKGVMRSVFSLPPDLVALVRAELSGNGNANANGGELRMSLGLKQRVDDLLVAAFLQNVTSALKLPQGWDAAVDSTSFSIASDASGGVGGVSASVEWSLSSLDTARAFVGGGKHIALGGTYLNTTFVATATTPRRELFPQSSGGGGSSLSPVAIGLIVAGSLGLLCLALLLAALCVLRGKPQKAEPVGSGDRNDADDDEGGSNDPEYSDHGGPEELGTQASQR